MIKVKNKKSQICILILAMYSTMSFGFSKIEGIIKTSTQYDTSYFYTYNGMIDTIKILTDTTYHWGGSLIHDFGATIYGQYHSDKDQNKTLYGKCLGFINTFYFTNEYNLRVLNRDLFRVVTISYYDDVGNRIKSFGINYFTRKIESVY